MYRTDSLASKHHTVRLKRTSASLNFNAFKKRPKPTRVNVGSSGVNGPVGSYVIFCSATLARCRSDFKNLRRTSLTAEFEAWVQFI